MTYVEKLKDPRWQKKRLEILQRDEFECQSCGDKESTLHVHHYTYSENPWDTPDDDLLTLCEKCHAEVEQLKKDCAFFLRHLQFKGIVKAWANMTPKEGHAVYLLCRELGVPE